MNMKKPRTFKVSLTYNQVIEISRLIDEYIFRNVGEDTNYKKNKIIKELQDAKNELISSYTGLK